jgi:hypothetical protein
MTIANPASQIAICRCQRLSPDETAAATMSNVNKIPINGRRAPVSTTSGASKIKAIKATSNQTWRSRSARLRCQPFVLLANASPSISEFND